MSAAAASQSSSSTWSRSRLPVPVIGGSKSKQTVSATSIPVEARQRVASNSSADSMTLTGSSSTANRSKRQRSALPRPTTWFTSPSKSQTTVHSSSQPCRSMESDGDDDFVMVSVSPKAPPPESRNAPYIFGSTRPHPTTSETSTGPAVACGMTMAAQRLSLMETEDADDALTIDDSPIRFPAGQSRSLGPTGRGGAIMGRRRSTEERDSPEAARRFTSASVVSGGSIRQNEAVSDLTRSWMKRSRADVSPLGNQAFRRGSSPPPPDTPIHQNAAHTATSSFLGRPPPPQPLFPTLRPSHSFSRGGDDQQSVFLSPFPKKTSSSSSSSTSAAKSRTIAHIDNKENNIFSAKKSVSFEGLGTSRRTEEDTFTFGLGACRRGVLGSSNHNGNLEQGASASLFTASNVSPFISAAATRAQHNFHRRANSNDHNRLGRYSHGGGSVISRSHGHKSGLAQSALSGSSMPKSISNDSHSSILSQATSSSTILTIPDTHVFDDVKPLQAAFEVSEGPVTRKFKPRDSGVGLGDQVAMPAVKPVVTVPINMGEEENIVGLGLMGLQPRPNGRSSVLGIKPARPQLLKRASSCGDERQSPVETPGIIPVDGSAWPTAFGVDFAAATAIGTTGFEKDAKPSMPDTPVKRSAFSLGGATTGQPVRTLARVGHSVSQPVLPTAATMSVMRPSTKAFDLKRMSPPPKPTFSLLCSSNNASTDMESESSSSPLPPTLCKILTGPSLTVTTTESPESPVVSMMETDELSPTVRLSNVRGASLASTRAADQNVRMGLLRRLSSGVASSSETEEGDDTPTKRNEREVGMLVPGSGHSSLTTPTPSPRLSTDKLPSPLAIPSNKDVISVTNADGSHLLAPRLSLPAFSSTKHGKRLNHRQSAPEHATVQDEDMFEKRFVIVEALGKGAFSQVFKVKERDGEGVFAVKKARGVFDGVKDRLRHLEEVDILRHLSSRPHPHVITFIDAWEQNRQLYIQTELCLGSLAFFLEEYGKLVERLDEGRTWKIARELADGIEYIHSMGVIHFDLKPANILITTCGALKIGDFGLASRWPRVNAASILAGSGLGGDVGSTSTSTNKIADREGDRVYMPPEMLRGHYSMAADIFSYGLMILEVATNIFVPDGGAPWHALRQNDFTVVDFSPLSPALTDLITTCMRADPAERPPISNITQHPVIARARATGKDALAPESEMFLVKVLTGDMILPTSASEPSPQDADVDMSDA